MIRAELAETRAIESWQDIQDAIRRAIAPLSDAQMNKRLAPSLRSPGEIAAHIVYGRAKWLHHVLGQEVAELEPFLSWDNPDAPPRTAAEVLHGLERTWTVVHAFLMRGEATDEIPDPEIEKRQTIWGLIDHDLPHSGELSLLLGADGLPGVEL